MAPLFAPIIGGHVLELAGWRFIFWLLADFGAVCIATILIARINDQIGDTGRRRIRAILTSLAESFLPAIQAFKRLSG